MYLNSRYASGYVPSPPFPDIRNSEQRSVPGPDLVIRAWANVDVTNAIYFWQDGDRLDRLAEYFGLPRLSWYMILDANPHVEFPTDIKPGTPLRIPASASRPKL